MPSLNHEELFANHPFISNQEKSKELSLSIRRLYRAAGLVLQLFIGVIQLIFFAMAVEAYDFIAMTLCL